MKSRREDDERRRRRRDEFEEGEARLPVPASPARIAPGGVGMVSGFLFAGFAGDSRRALPWTAVVILSPGMMLRRPKK